MIELGTAKRNLIAPICAGSREIPVQSAAQGLMGRVWTDDLDAPSDCLILFSGFSYLLGIPPKGESALSLLRLIRTECADTFIMPGSEQWTVWLEQNLDCSYRILTRYAMKSGTFDEEKLQKYASSLPQGYVLKKPDRYLLKKLAREDWSRPFAACYETEDQFLKQAIAYIVLHGRDPVSGCTSFCYAAGVHDIEIATKPDFRRKGLALCAASAFILDCLGRKLRPSWDASGLHSVALAEKLGFETEREYPVFQIADE